ETPFALPGFGDRWIDVGFISRKVSAMVLPMKISTQDIEQLTPEERIDLMERLWDSLSDEHLPVAPSVRAEIERRLETYPQDRAAAIPWDDAKATLLTPRAP